ncbi:MAG TPA: Gfo/Idh/MocA family oxidoreductase [Chloroflexota bacterium]|nr:Gfo/Idh/MocA family oxidoreductase [Chloroflexota bacterium]
MTRKPLTAIVIGAGFAGEGHTIALRECGVDVQAICARTPSAVQAMASKLGVPTASTDWRRTLEQTKPDIVAIATPGGTHEEMVTAALARGCHLYCDKPLAPDSQTARRLADQAQSAGVKHAYAATHRYDPSVAYIAELLRDGAIGQVAEVEATFRRHLHPLTPWTWYDVVSHGGGLLQNAFPHWLGILQRALGGPLGAAMGESRVMRERAPYVPEIHDFRLRNQHRPTEEQAKQLEWRDCDAEGAFTALLRFRSPSAPPEQNGEVQVSFSVTGHPAVWPANGFRFHGTEGTLRADGHYSFALSRSRSGERNADGTARWEALPVPERLLKQLPETGDEFQRKWTALARDFVADIRGEPIPSPDRYLTFEDGARFQAAIDAIRNATGLQRLV